MAGFFIPKFSLMEGRMYQILETMDELSGRWKVQKSWLYARTRQTGPGSIPRVKMGKYIRFVPEDVDAWLRKQNEEIE